MKYFLIISLIWLLLSCKNGTSSEQAIAKVGKEYLYASQLLGDDYTATERENITEEQINDWIKRRLWLKEAKKNIENNLEIKNKVKDYEQSLIINSYQDKLIQKSKANFITKEDVIAYYTKHKSDFILNENQYKIQYVELSSEINNLDEIIATLNQEKQNQFILDHCAENKNLCLLEPTWVNDEKLREIELPDFVWNTSAKFESYYKNNNKVCLFRIIEKKKEGEYIPLELVSEEIATILNFSKSKELLKKQEDQLFKNAQNNQDFEIYK